MKLLLISQPSIHLVRWIENILDSDFEIYWWDILDRGPINLPQKVTQVVHWNKRKVPYIRGEYWLEKKHPRFFNKVKSFVKLTEGEKLKFLIESIAPDVIHSFEMHSSAIPIYNVMKNNDIKWIYSCWGNDIYFYKEDKRLYNKMKNVLQRIDYLHVDNYRDKTISNTLGYTKEYLVIPTGGGFHIDKLLPLKQPLKDRKIILVKGYHHQFGRALYAIKALETLKDALLKYEIVVFGAHRIVMQYIAEQKSPYKVHGRSDLSHDEVLALMGTSLFYIGNSISDGMPNTLLEAMTLGAIPIQSNPGGATQEIINDGENGFLIHEPENVEHIASVLKKAIAHETVRKKGPSINDEIARERLDFAVNKRKIMSIYNSIK